MSDAGDFHRYSPADLADVLRETAYPTDRASKRASRNDAPVTRCLANVKPEPVRWLWPGRIACGKVTLIVGDPGLGKSFSTLDIAARVSTGAAWPDGRAAAQGAVILLSAEDDAADTIRPRLDAASANVSRIHILDAVRKVDADSGETSERMPTLADTAVLAETIQAIGDVRLIIVDPVSAYLGSVDSHKNAELRALLSPLANLAATYGIAVVAVSHLNKSAGAAIYRTQGSLAFTAAARAVWAVTKDKDDETRRLLLPVKNNLAPDISGLAYRIQSRTHGASIEWEPDPVHMDVSDTLTTAVRDEERSGCDEAAEWLTDVLRHGAIAVKELKKESTAAGFSWRTIERAKCAAGAVARKRDFSAGWCWEIREDRQDRHDPYYSPRPGGLRAWIKPEYIITPRANGHDNRDAEVF